MGGLTPKPELQRNERARRAVKYYGNVVNSEDVTMDDSRHQKRKDHSLLAVEMNRTTDDNVKRFVVFKCKFIFKKIPVK